MPPVQRTPFQNFNPRTPGADAYIFGGLLIGGILLILFLRELDFRAELVIAVPIVIIILYGWLAVYLQTHKYQPDRTADNCYYMGFLFTLVSLAYALYKFTTGDRITESLINDFGVAIASTIVGMTARLLLIQIRPESTGTENNAHDQLTDATHRFRIELFGAATDFKHYRTALNQMFKEAMHDAAQESNKHLQESTRRFKEFTESALGDISHIHATQKKDVENFSIMVAKTTQTLERLQEQIVSLDAPFELIRQHLPPAIEKIETAATAMSAAGATLGERAAAESSKNKELAEQIERITRSGELLNQRIQDSARNLQDTGQLYEQIMLRLETAESHSNEHIKQHIEKMAKVFDKLTSAVDRFSQGLHGSDSKLDQLTTKLNLAWEIIQKLIAHTSELNRNNRKTASNPEKHPPKKTGWPWNIFRRRPSGKHRA